MGFLVKHFIKDSENVKNPTVREQYGMLTGIIGVICNVLLFGVKLAVGLILSSVSVMADAFNNLSDAASSVVGFVGAKLSNRPADEEHPFGHGRYEYIAALIVAFLVFEVGFTCLKDSIAKIQNPEAIGYSLILVIVLFASIFVKLWLGLMNRKLGKRIDSTVMKATATDAFGDMIITFATTAAILISHLTGLNLDGYMGLVVSLFVIYAGIGIIRETLQPLLGQAASAETYKAITEFVESHEGIVGTHDLIVHSYGPSTTMASIHAEVPRDVDIEVSHEIIDRIEQAVKTELGIFIVIHMDPVEVNDEEVKKKKHMVARIVSEMDEDASIHDFRLVNGEEQVNLIFDLVVPYQCKGDKQVEFVKTLRQRVHNEDERCQCVIMLEHSYVKKG